MNKNLPKVYRWYERNRITAPVGESKTDRSFGNDTDINKLIDRFSRTGVMPENPSGVQPYYGDVSEMQCDLTELIEKSKHGVETLQLLKEQQKLQQEEQAAKDQAELELFRKWKEQQPDGAEAPQEQT